MIKETLKLQNIALMRDACESGAVDLGRVTAIYSGNGRGKSTLTAVLRASELGDAGRKNARKIIDSGDPLEVDLLMPTRTHVEFKANTRTGSAPAIAVFD